MKSLIAIPLLLNAILLCSGCATVTRGTNDVLVVESDPSGANVRLSNGMTGKTPTSFKLSRRSSLTVTISREGYETLHIQVNPVVAGAGAAGMAGNVLLGGIIGIGVDAATGATMNLKPNPIQAKMVPIRREEEPRGTP